MVEGSRIRVFVGDTMLSGEIVHLIPRSIDVGITEPYSGVTQSLSIPFFACWNPRVRYFQSAGLITEHGIETAEWLLCELGRNCDLVSVHRAELAATHLRLAGEAAAKFSGIDHAEHCRRRAQLRDQFKSGRIKDKEYQRSLRLLRASLWRPSDARLEAEATLSRFIRERHGGRIPLGTMRCLINKFLA